MLRNLVVTLVACLVLAPAVLAGYPGGGQQVQAPIVVNVPPPVDEGFFSDAVIAALIAGTVTLLGVAITVRKRR